MLEKMTGLYGKLEKINKAHNLSAGIIHARA